MSQFQSDVNTAASLLYDLDVAVSVASNTNLTEAMLGLSSAMASGFTDPTTVDQAAANNIRSALLAVETAASGTDAATAATALHAHLDYMLTTYRTDIDPTFSGGKRRV